MHQLIAAGRGDPQHLIDHLGIRVREFIPAAQTLLAEKTSSAVALAQKRLTAALDVIFTLPMYRDLPMGEENSYHLFAQLMADEEKWA